jgi:hypothetical protein
MNNILQNGIMRVENKTKIKKTWVYAQKPWLRMSSNSSHSRQRSEKDENLLYPLLQK